MALVEDFESRIAPAYAPCDARHLMAHFLSLVP